MNARVFIAAVAAIIAIKIALTIAGRFAPISDYENIGKLEKNMDFNDPFTQSQPNHPSMNDVKKVSGQGFFNKLSHTLTQNPAVNAETKAAEPAVKKKTAAELYNEEQKKLADAKKKKARKAKMKKLAKKLREQEEQKRLDAENRQKLLAEWLNRRQTPATTTTDPSVGYNFGAAPSPAPATATNTERKPLKREGPFAPADIEAWAEKLTKDPTVQDARAFIALYFTGQISKEDFYHVLTLMQQSPNPKARRFAVMGAALQQNPEAFIILAELSFGDPSQEVAEAANKSIVTYRTITSLNVLSSTLTVDTSIATRIRAIDLVAEVASQFRTNGAGERDAFRPLIPILENLAKESNPEIKSRAQTTLMSIKRILGTA